MLLGHRTTHGGTRTPHVGLKAALCGRCISSERVDNELELGTDLDDAVLYKDKKLKDQVEVAIGDGMEFTIPGNNLYATVSSQHCPV